ncbi:hypothetical protein FNF31_04080 [Cafeteria roenbergensis]|uniref:Ion transport domain-containing protein n=1 Tax=Cafeteria roenbergensis TaxID=33653 RepID=A0A5A8DA64_CAFRO|nr:hypothetical protein FNF31_04080 [Cafeteria roenbergensis]
MGAAGLTSRLGGGGGGGSSLGGFPASVLHPSGSQTGPAAPRHDDDSSTCCASWGPTRARLQLCLDDRSGTPEARAVAYVVVAVIAVNATATVVETVEPVVKALPVLFFPMLEAVCTVFFTIELLMRLAIADSCAAWRHDWLNVVDLLAILPWYLEFVLEALDALDGSGGSFLGFLRILRLLRVLRLFKLSRFLRSAQQFVEVLVRSSRSLAVLSFFFVMATVLLGYTIFTLEDLAGSPTARDEYGLLRHVPLAMYWVMTMITSVGYGTVVPMSTSARIFAGINTISGLVLMSLAVNIITTHFLSLLKEEELMGEIQQRRAEADRRALGFGLDDTESVDFVLQLVRDKWRSQQAGIAPDSAALGDDPDWPVMPTARERAIGMRRARSADDFTQAARRQSRGEVGDPEWDDCLAAASAAAGL